MRIIHTTNWLTRLGGGVAQVVWQVAQEQQTAGDSVSLLAMSDRYETGDWPTDRHPGISVHTFPANGPQAAFWSFGLHAALLDPAIGGSADILHQHGIWSTWSHSVNRWGKRWQRPSVLAIHGGLSDATMKRHPWRKRVFGLLCGKRCLQSATCLHALCEAEVRNIRNQGIRAPIALVPNGVHLRQYDNLPHGAEFARRFPRCKHRPLVLYLGRIHPLKGVSPLLEAWKRLRKHRRAGWLLVIAGPNDFGFADQMKRKTEALSIQHDVLFPGPLYKRAKLEALAAASLFVLPSLSEGFPTALLEAMACKLPLVQTRACNFDEVEAAGAGWVGEPTADSLAEMLDAALCWSQDGLQATGRRGYDLAQQKYTWDRIIPKLELVYQWMLGGGAAPSYVRAA